MTYSSMYYDPEKKISRFLTEVHVLSTRDYEKALSEMSSICTYMYMNVHVCARNLLVPGGLYGFYSYSVFKNLSITGPWPVNMNILH
jgi:hypothetical protein